MGAYHTVILEMNRQFTLNKQEWDSITLERIGDLILFCSLPGHPLESYFSYYFLLYISTLLSDGL